MSFSASPTSRRRFLIAGSTVTAAAAVAALPGAQAAAAASTCEARYAGYRDIDRAQPYAKYFKSRTDAPQRQVPAALAAGPVAPALIPTRAKLADDIHNPGYGAVETGYGKLASGEIWVACLTDMPRVTPAMWDWWFGWHSKESARYKLWHPDAHQYAALRYPRVDQPGLTDKQKYIGNTSYVDEIIGGHLDQLAIGFVEPSKFKIDTNAFDGTAICATVGTSLVPVNIGQLVHQVRRTARGSEMRSRFYLNVPGTRGLDTDSIACAVKRGVSLPKSILFDTAFGAALLEHCGQEMNHLAQFLPELYAEFSGR
ncbi:MAG: hypothetical protein Q7T55_15505 [Solirubrobacteraceae bacterium]|nr:hypothetical protein [Solirubrobacteraceae bacterium]